jgi:hypothetical protein
MREVDQGIGVLKALVFAGTLLFAGGAGAAGKPTPSPSPAPAETSTGTAEVERKYYVEDIKEAMTAYIAAQVNAEGVFRLRDDKTGEMLDLRFVKIHDPVRRIDGNTYFACTDFSVEAEPDKLYDLDFWMRPKAGRLEIYDAKVHKEPRRSLVYGWYKQPRYTFVDDKVVSLY